MRTDPLLKFETIFGFKLNCPSNARHGLILESKTNNSSHLCDTTLADFGCLALIFEPIPHRSRSSGTLCRLDRHRPFAGRRPIPQTSKRVISGRQLNRTSMWTVPMPGFT